MDIHTLTNFLILFFIITATGNWWQCIDRLSLFVCCLVLAVHQLPLSAATLAHAAGMPKNEKNEWHVYLPIK